MYLIYTVLNRERGGAKKSKNDYVIFEQPHIYILFIILPSILTRTLKVLMYILITICLSNKYFTDFDVVFGRVAGLFQRRYIFKPH